MSDRYLDVISDFGEPFTSIAAAWREEPGWADPKPFECDEIRGKAPNMSWGMEMRPRGFAHWATAYGELTT